MKKILFMVPYPPGKAPSQRFRFEHFLKFMEQNDSQCDFQPFVSVNDWDSLYSEMAKSSGFGILLSGFLTRIKGLFNLKMYDIIFIHRELTPIGPPIFEWIIAKILKKKIIYDFDDAIWLPDQNKESTIWRWLKWRSKVTSICKWSWKVSVGNEYLAEYARRYNDEVIIMPTVVDTEIHKPLTPLHPPSMGDKVVIGWTGSHSTLQYLNKILPALQQFEKSVDFEFRVIANKDPQLTLKNYSFIKWNKESEIEDLNTFDIGVMPLPNDEWSKGKCGFKLIQYLALEIPAVASPVGVNKEIISHRKNGFLANSHQEWMDGLTKLIQDKTMRKAFGKLGRNLILRNYSAESQKGTFLSLFNDN
ncbi:MAG: glycosyltransferase [Bacteroidota bacterium]